MQGAKEITFGQFRLDLANECLWHGARSISLRPKAFAVLKLLVAHPGQLVSKQQVLDTVWPGTFVGDAVLKDNIRQLREALDDDAVAPTYIETAHRRGYRFIGKPSEPVPANNPIAWSKPAPALAPDIAAVASSMTTSEGLLGREAELSKLRSGLARALAGERQTIFVTGEPGIGKTTLVNAFVQHAAHIPGLLVARGQCFEHYGSGEAYLPVLDGISRLCRLPEGGQVLDLLRQHAPGWLAQMPSLLPQSERQTQSPAGGTTRERMLREMAEAIETLTSQSPLLLVLEDLHWSDYSTLDLISYLARRHDPARLMIIGTYRPVDVIIADHPLKGVKRELQAHALCQDLALNYLSEESVAEFLATRFPGHRFPVRLRHTIHRRTEGNPLFMVNLVEYLLDQQIIIQEAAGWNLRSDCSDLEKGVPSNLRQLIEKQIERLSPDERLVLEGASVVGLECSSVAIAAGLDKPIDWVEKHCEELARRHQFLSPAALVELPDGTTTSRYRFIHVLYLDVPYRLIPPMRRSQIHQRIAVRGAAIYGKRDVEIAAELAMHFEQSRDWPSAVRYLLRAAENAAAQSAHHEVSDLANRGLEALKLVPDTPEHAKAEMKLRMILIASLMAIKGFASAEVESINARGRELFWRHGPSPELFYMLWSLNMYHQFIGQMQSSIDISYQLMDLAEDLKDSALVMEAHRSIGAVLTLSGRYSEALEHLDKGNALYDLHHDGRDAVFVSFDSKVMFECFAALALLPLGLPDQSSRRMAAGLALARKLGHAQTLVVALHIAAQLSQLRGEASLSHQYAREGLEIADEYGFENWRIYGLIELGWAEAQLGNPQTGIEKMQRGLAEYEATGSLLRSQYFMGMLADQMGKVGRTDDAFVVIDKALSIATRTGEGYALAELHRVKGDLFLKENAFSEDTPSTETAARARACFSEAFAVAKQQNAKWWELRAAISLENLARITGEPSANLLAATYTSFNEGFDTPDLVQARSLLETVSAR